MHGSVSVPTLQKFWKRLRKRIAPLKIRFFACGEYGERFERPHYHAIVFGFDFPDRRYHSEVNENTYYTSALLADVWGLGHCVVGAATFKSAAYVARYCQKKVNGEKAEEHYLRLDSRTGELVRVAPEFATMSRRPGIGQGYIEKYGEEVRKHDSVVVDGRERPIPRFYESVFDDIEVEAVKGSRVSEAALHSADLTPERLRARATVAEARLSLSNRRYEK